MITGDCCVKKFYIKNPKIMDELNIIEVKRKQAKQAEKKAIKQAEKKAKEDKEISEKVKAYIFYDKEKINNEQSEIKAMNSKINFKKYKGLTYLEVSQKDPKYLRWLIDNNIIKLNDKYPINKFIIEWIKSLNIQ